MHVSVAIAQVNKTQFKIAITQITKQQRSGEKIFSSEQVAAAKIPVHWVLVVSFIISMMIYQYGKNNNSEREKQNLISLRRKIFFSVLSLSTGGKCCFYGLALFFPNALKSNLFPSNQKSKKIPTDDKPFIYRNENMFSKQKETFENNKFEFKCTKVWNLISINVRAR